MLEIEFSAQNIMSVTILIVQGWKEIHREHLQG